MDLPDLPEGWRLLSLIDITVDTPCWSARVASINREYTHGTGSTLRYAMLAAIDRIENDDVYAPLEDPTPTATVDLRSLLKIGKPAVNVDRRD